MKKPQWYKDLPHDWQEVVDQALHFTAGFLISAVAGPLVSIGFAIGREVLQNWGDKDNNYVDMAIDLSVWSIGAVLASLAF